MGGGVPHIDFLPPMTPSQATDLLAADRVMPGGGDRDDYRSGRLLALATNLARRRGDPARTWTDFYPEHRRKRAPKAADGPEAVSRDLWGKFAAIGFVEKAKPAKKRRKG